LNVVFSFQKNNLSQPQKQNVAFGAGLTRKMMHEIQHADVLEISSRLAKKGIPTDFKGNKVVAWCCDKTLEIFEQLNRRFGQRLALPKGIFVEDFERLNVDNPNMYGFCNLQPTKLVKSSDELVPSRVVYFNSFANQQQIATDDYKWLSDWNYINTISDARLATKESGTDHFLDIFMHEFFHVSHEDRLLSKLGGQTLARKIAIAKNKQQIAEYQRKYGQRITQICDYALADPFEAVACDMSRSVVGSLDRNTLVPIRNPFVGTPYERFSLWQRINTPYYTDEQRPLTEILRNFWNGKFN